MLDADAADRVVDAIQRLTEATIARKNAQRVYESSQQTLAIAQRNLDSVQQMDRVHVNEKAQQSYDAFLIKRAEARANEQAAREKGEPETVLPDQTAPGNVSNEGDERNPLAPGNGSGIMEEEAQGEDTGGVGGAEKLVRQTASTNKFEYFVELTKKVDVSTGANQAVFYSGKGNRELAEAFALTNGNKILELTPGGKYFDGLKLFDKGSPLTETQALEIWKILSKRYAEAANGNVYGFVKGSNPSSIFNTVEYHALQGNPKVTNIFTELFK